MTTKLTVEDVIALEIQAFPIMLQRPAEDVASMIALYALKLADLDPHVISAAFETLGGQYPPSYHQIREAAAKILTGQIGARTAEDAWKEANRLARLHGAWHAEFRTQYERDRPGFTPTEGPPGITDDPALERAIAAVGWNVICLTEDEASKNANRKRFIDAYNNETTRALELAKLSPRSRALVESVRLQISSGSGTLAQLMTRKDNPK